MIHAPRRLGLFGSSIYHAVAQVPAMTERQKQRVIRIAMYRTLKTVQVHRPVYRRYLANRAKEVKA
jgi:hypothetical protein